LLDFNGGASCVQVYVNQHDFFINRVQKDVESDDTVLSVFYDDVAMAGHSFKFRWRSLADPDTIPPKNESSLTELLVEIRATVGQEAQIVQAVFPNPSLVMQVFLQRVFAQSVIKHKSSPSYYAKIVIDPTTHGTAPLSRWQHVRSSVFAHLTVDPLANVRTR
jgi:hypothetical protein